MTNDFGQPPSTPLPGPATGNLLPVLGPLLPPTNIPLMVIASAGEAELSGQFQRAVAEAKSLTARATTLAIENAPRIRKIAAEATAQSAAIANRTFKEAQASALTAGAALADPQARRAAMRSHGKAAVITLGIAVAVTASGWQYLGHRAAITAKDQIDGFLIRRGLRTSVAYDSVTASPLGSTTLSGVRLIAPDGGWITKIGTLKVSDLEMKGDVILRIALAATNVEIPVLALAHKEDDNPLIKATVALGYTTVRGEATLNVRTDDSRGTVLVQTSAAMGGMGSWDATFQLGGLTADTLAELMTLSQQAGQDASRITAGQRIEFMRMIGRLSLERVSLTLEDSGYIRRSEQVTDLAVPPDSAAPPVSRGPDLQTDLVRGGLPPGEAQAIETTLQNWLSKGGTIHLETNLGSPMPLFRDGNIFTPTFASMGAFLSVTKARVSG